MPETTVPCPACWREQVPDGGRSTAACKTCWTTRIARLTAQAEAWRQTPRTTDAGELITAVLHVGFLCLLETAEELDALRGEGPPVKKGKASKSKIAAANGLLIPIDRVTARVVPES